MAPPARAANGNDAAGYTMEEVPIDRKASQLALAAMASSISASGIGSSNQTTSGRSRPPQLGHLGGTSLVFAQSAMIVPSSKHFVREMLPCSSMTFRLPA